MLDRPSRERDTPPDRRAAVRRRAWIGLLGLLLPALAGAQGELDPSEPSSYFDAMPVHPSDEGILRLLDEIDADCVKIERVCRPGVELLQLLFQGSYRDELPDFIVHLQRKEAEGRLVARQPLMLFDRRNTPYLHGVQHLWILVFSDRQVEMNARLTTIQEKAVNPFGGVLGVFGITAGERTPEAKAEDVDVEISWQTLSEAGSEEPLLVGTARVPVKNDAVSRLTLIPREPDKVAFQSITAHFSNSRSSFAAFSVALGATFGTDDTGLAEEGGDPFFNGYVLAKFYVPGRRPRLEVSPTRRTLYRRSMAIVFGTNVTNDSFQEIVLGLSFGHVIGKAGFVVAGNAIEGAGDSSRTWRGLFGVDYTF